MRKTELFFGYAFALAGVSLPYLIEHLSGSAAAALWTCVLLLAAAAVLLFLGHRSREQDVAVESLFHGAIPVPPKLKPPSLIFVFGAPLGDNDSSTWIMMLKHYGPDIAHNCTVDFFDDDRKNIEHRWLVEHGSPPFLPTGQFDESQKRFHVAEAGPEAGSVSSFNWTPVDPNRQHYTVSINCRDGGFIEKWEVTRVNGVLRTKIVIEHGSQWRKNNPGLNPVVFRCEDPEFMSTPLAVTIPHQPQKILHPGWKPSHRFEIPVAIIDFNHHVQVMSGVRQPDGSTQTDFGCWNILTKHFGEESPS
jgi:hypothetical protein